MIGVLFTLLAVSVCEAHASYDIIDLGTLDHGTDSRAYGINNSGQIVGRGGRTGDTRIHPILWSDGEIIDLPIHGYQDGYAWGINDKGHTVGLVTDTLHQTSRAVSWENASIRYLGSLPGFVSSDARAINNKGQIVGGSHNLHTGNNHGHATLWSDGEIIDLGTLPGGTYSFAWDINESSQIVGLSNAADGRCYAVMWENGVIRDLGVTPSGSGNTYAIGINNLGHVVGMTGDGVNRGFFWDGTSTVFLDAPFYMSLYDINDSDQIVGYAYNLDYQETHAYLWWNGEKLHLGISGISRSEAYAINDLGQIVGYTSTEAGEHAFLASPSPVPIPSGVWLLGSGLIGLWGFRRKFRKS